MVVSSELEKTMPNMTPQDSYFDASTCDIDAFESLITQSIKSGDLEYATQVVQNVPIYDVAALSGTLTGAPEQRRALMAEWAWVLRSGPGALALRGAYADTRVLDEATEVYQDIIDAETRASGAKADHFAASGANDRIWNSLQKLCLANPDVYLRYFANPAIAAVCEAWLGPNYQMTAQVNLVHPGGAAQQAHRDYHLGFQTADISASYPAHVHDLSPVLTLQGAVAHCDMPTQSGPTKLLPFSQAYRAGYAAWRRDDFRALFEVRCVQIPLQKGDALFFSPALFHGAGENTSADIHRLANLLQVSSAFGRAMETIDRHTMCELLYPLAQTALRNQSLTPQALDAAIAATAEGYAFPTNLDNDPPVGGLAPETQQAFFKRALDENLSPEAFAQHLNTMRDKQRP
jgi:ectoine hydroxylase-related dioxygenase (phytanoyl-CoA dioxygenase family)